VTVAHRQAVSHAPLSYTPSQHRAIRIQRRVAASLGGDPEESRMDLPFRQRLLVLSALHYRRSLKVRRHVFGPKESRESGRGRP
jgi:hypothetical protein